MRNVWSLSFGSRGFEFNVRYYREKIIPSQMARFDLLMLKVTVKIKQQKEAFSAQLGDAVYPVHLCCWAQHYTKHRN